MAQVKLDAMPKELLELVGMDKFSDMSNYITYFGMIFNMLLIVISIFSASFSASILSKEEKNKTIEFLYALEVERYEIYVSRLITAFVAVISVVSSGVMAAAIAGSINGGSTFVAGDFIKIVKVSGFTPFFFMALSLMVAGISTKIGAPMVGSMTVLISYVLGYLSKLIGNDAQWLSKLSPFEMLTPENAITLEGQTLVVLVIYFTLSICFVVIGGIVYKRRDFNV